MHRFAYCFVFSWSLEGVVVTLDIRFRAGDKNTRITTHEHEVLFPFVSFSILVRAPSPAFFPFFCPLRIA
jgi:hypothetical protein